MPRIPGLISGKQFLALADSQHSQGDAAPKKGGKYGATPVRDGHDQFDSKREADWAWKLRQLEQGGIIKNLKLDKRELRWALDVNEVRICDYEADARFDVMQAFDLSGLTGVFHLRAGEHVVCDAKSPPTRKKRDYVLKRNLMFAIHQIRILEL
jgi:hypothetical protein